jgi:hypothetical protein
MAKRWKAAPEKASRQSKKKAAPKKRSPSKSELAEQRRPTQIKGTLRRGVAPCSALAHGVLERPTIVV